MISTLDASSKEIHEVLMSGARGGTKAPGEFRRRQNWIGGTRPGNAATVTAAFKNLESLGIVREITGKQRGRVFLYDEYLKILQKGTEPFDVN